MDIKEMETLIRNIDARTRRMEQILPTLATKTELGQLNDGMQTLATKAELREQGDRIILRTEVLIENLRADIRLIAENQIMLHQRIDKLESRG